MGVNFLVAALGAIWLTRQLTPDDYGLFGMVLFITGFAQLFVDWGLSRAVVQKPEITHEQVSTLFWFSLTISVLLSLIVAAATPWIVKFYDEPRVASINIAMSGLYVLGGLTMQHRALLQRRMEFGKLNTIAVIAPLVATLVAVVIAFYGGGYWALVSMPAVSQLVTCVGVWRACRWRPGPPRRHTGVREFLAFGGHVTIFHFINYLFRNADNAMIGFVWGSGPLGLYTRAYSLMMLPATKFNTPITQVIVPALSRLQHSAERYREAYQRTIRLVAAMTAIPTTLLILTAPEILPLLLGHRWDDVVPVFVALGPAAIMAGTNVAAGWLYLSCGHVDRQTRWGVIASVFLLAPIVFTLPYGVLAVAIAVSVSRVLIQLPSVSYACHGTPLRTRDYIKATFFVVTLPFIASVVASLTYALIACRFWGLEPSLSHVWEATTLPVGATLGVMLFKLALMVGLLLVTVLCWPAAREAYSITLAEWKRFRTKGKRPSEVAPIEVDETTDEKLIS